MRVSLLGQPSRGVGKISSESQLGGALILLFGWLGSKERYVEKYAKLWRELGAHPVTCRPSIAETAVPALGDTAAVVDARRLAEAYDRRCQTAGQQPPIIVHCMSGAGFIAFGTLLHLTSLLDASPHVSASSNSTSSSSGSSSSSSVSSSASSNASSSTGPVRSAAAFTVQQRAHPLVLDPRARQALLAAREALTSTRGVVVDSAPPLFTPAIWSRGLVSALLSVDADTLEERYPLAVRTARALTERYFQVHGVHRRMQEVRHAWQHAVPLCPQLYLYSLIDPLVPHQHIELFIEQQRARGAEVHAHAWADSGHCDHLRRHPAQYRQLLLSFAEHALHGERSGAEAWI